MSEGKAESKQRFAWSGVAGTVATGLLLAALNYGFSVLATAIFSERADIYFVERPSLPNGKFQRLLVIDNYSSSVLGEIEFSLIGEGVTLNSPINIDKLDQRSVAPRTVAIKISGVLPNRQASFELQSDIFVPDDSFRFVKSPIGLNYRSKDKLFDSWFVWPFLINAIIQFAFYVAGIFYFERYIVNLRSQAKDVKEGYERVRSALEELERRHVRIKLLYMRKVMSLSRENRLWRDASIGLFQNSSNDGDFAKKLLSVLLKKAGIRPTRTLEDLDEEELIEAIQEAEPKQPLRPNY